MSTSSPLGGRICPGCHKPLAPENTATLCARCHREQRDELRTPPAQLRHDFFETDEFRAAFQSQHIGNVFRAYRNHPRHLQLFGKALTQDLLGRWLGLTQAQVSRLENGKQEHNLELLRNYARILHLPRHMLWFDFPGESRLILPASANDGRSDDNSARDSILVANTGMDTLELLARVRASAIDSATIDGIGITVDQLCCDYAHADAAVLVQQGREWLEQISRVLEQRVTFKQHRDLLHNAGMLALLVGCLEYDLGDQRAAEATRRMAMSLGDDSGDANIVGWSHEMLAWFHLTAGNFRAVIPAAQAGIDAAPSMSVAVQLYGQQAKAYARLGMAEEVHTALERGSALLDALPYPERPENHFVVDPDKWDFYAMDTYRIVGDNKHAKRNAEEVIRRSVTPDGFMLSPMRHTEAQLTLAVISAREGEVEEASTLGLAALQQGRQSRPSLIMVGQELEKALRAHGPSAGAEFREMFTNLKRAK